MLVVSPAGFLLSNAVQLSSAFPFAGAAALGFVAAVGFTKKCCAGSKLVSGAAAGLAFVGSKRSCRGGAECLRRLQAIGPKFRRSRPLSAAAELSR